MARIYLKLLYSILLLPSPLVLEHPLHAAVNEAEVRELDPELRVAVAGPRLPPHPPRLPRPRLAASAVRPQLRVGEHPAPEQPVTYQNIFFATTLNIFF